MVTENNLILLENWYLKQCNGKWEHAYGIKIRTLDNPGWHVKICLNDTSLKNKSFNPIYIERTHNNWIHCIVGDDHFNAHGGPQNLSEIIDIFLAWAEEHS